MTNPVQMSQNSNHESSNPWGFSMKGIQPAGRCSNCRQGKFKKDERRGYVCADCGNSPDYFLIVIHYKGERIRRRLSSKIVLMLSLALIVTLFVWPIVIVADRFGIKRGN